MVVSVVVKVIKVVVKVALALLVKMVPGHWRR